MQRRVLVIAALLGVLAAGRDVAAQHITPTIVGWERYFAVRWEATERGGRPHLRGEVTNLYGLTAWRVQLLVESLDASGQIVAQRVEWLGGAGDVAAFSRRYFEIPAPAPASTYRVRIFAFLLQSP